MSDEEMSLGKVEFMMLASDIFASWSITKALREDLVMGEVSEVSDQLLHRIENDLEKVKTKSMEELNQNLAQETYANLFRERLTGLHICLQELERIIQILSQNPDLYNRKKIIKRVSALTKIIIMVNHRVNHYIITK